MQTSKYGRPSQPPLIVVIPPPSTASTLVVFPNRKGLQPSSSGTVEPKALGDHNKSIPYNRQQLLVVVLKYTAHGQLLHVQNVPTTVQASLLCWTYCQVVSAHQNSKAQVTIRKQVITLEYSNLMLIKNQSRFLQSK